MNPNPLPIVLVVVVSCSCVYGAPPDGSPLMLLGLQSGELVRCQYENLTACTPLYRQDAPVNAFAVLGEFIYFGLKSGELRRCPLPHPDHTPSPHRGNCTTFHLLESEIHALAVAGKNIYVATVSGITSCGLRLSETCTVFYETETTVYSLTVFGKTIYAGLYDSLITCPLGTPSDCAFTPNNGSSTASALAVSNQHLFMGRADAVDMCELQTPAPSHCYELFNTSSPVEALDVFGKHIHATLEDGDIIRFDFETNATTTLAKKEGALSVFTTFDTKKLYHHYRGESMSCSWQWRDCPPYILYYDIESRFPLELTVKDNKLYYAADGKLFDTSQASMSHSGRSAIFVMDPAGRLYASNTHPILLIHHSSLAGGMPVAAAGEIRAEGGEIQAVTTCSGHYRPSLKLVEQIKYSLKRQGYDKPYKIEDCGFLELYIDLDYKKTDLYYKCLREEYAMKLKHKNLGNTTFNVISV